MDQISIRFIRQVDVAAFKTLRLEALREHPEAFGSDYEENSRHPESFWIERVTKSIDDPVNCIVLADAGDELAGMMGVYRSHGVKNSHAGNIWGVYVRPKYRGKKLTDRMIEQAMQWCRSKQLRIVRLAVNVNNAAAIRCYLRCGFMVYGTSPQELRIGEVYHDEQLMWRSV